MSLKSKIILLSLLTLVLFVSSKVAIEAAPPAENRVFLTIQAFIEYSTGIEERLEKLEKQKVECYIDYKNDINFEQEASKESVNPEVYLKEYLDRQWVDGWRLSGLSYNPETKYHEFLFKKCYYDNLNLQYEFIVLKLSPPAEDPYQYPEIPEQYQSWDNFFTYSTPDSTSYYYFFRKEI